MFSQKLCNFIFNGAARLPTKLPVRLPARLYSDETEKYQTHEKTINQITLLGRVGGEPQKRGTEEHPVVIFHLATHSSYKQPGGDFTQKTDWHRIVCFRPGLRDAVYSYLKKGQRVHVSGRLVYGEIKSDSGNPITTSSIVADEVIFFQV